MPKYKRSWWSAEEDEYLKQHYPWNPIKKTTAALNRSKSAVIQRAGYLGLESELRKEREWSEADIDFLEWALPEMGIKRCSEILGRSPNAVKCVCRRKKVSVRRVNPDWTTEDIQYLRDNLHNKSASEIALQLGRSTRAVQWKADEIGLAVSVKVAQFPHREESPDSPPVNQPWDPADDEALIYMGGIGQSWDKIGQILNRSASAAELRYTTLADHRRAAKIEKSA